MVFYPRWNEVRKRKKLEQKLISIFGKLSELILPQSTQSISFVRLQLAFKFAKLYVNLANIA